MMKKIVIILSTIMMIFWVIGLVQWNMEMLRIVNISLGPLIILHLIRLRLERRKKERATREDNSADESSSDKNDK